MGAVVARPPAVQSHPIKKLFGRRSRCLTALYGTCVVGMLVVQTSAVCGRFVSCVWRLGRRGGLCPRSLARSVIPSLCSSSHYFLRLNDVCTANRRRKCCIYYFKVKQKSSQNTNHRLMRLVIILNLSISMVQKLFVSQKVYFNFENVNQETKQKN